MKARVGSALAMCVAVVGLVAAAPAHAHSASDAYLTLDVDDGNAGSTRVRVQWDIALRDLDFVMRLDDDGDGDITWKELRGHQAAIGRYALDRIAFTRGGSTCTSRLAKQLVDDHADGAYAALFIDVVCPKASTALTLDYRLFFAIDPSHRAIVVARRGDRTATALLSPEHPTIDLPGGPPAQPPPR